MIIPIRNQPITFAAAEGEVAACGDQSGYCQLVRLNDKICFQLRQESCLAQLLCNNDFSIFGTDLLEDSGDFYTSGEYGDWSANPDTWYWDSYGRRACTIEGHAGSPLTWTLDPYAMSAICTYVLRFEISGYVAPEGEGEDVYLTVTLPDGTEQLVITDGAYEFISGTGTSFSFDPGILWSGCLDNITLECAGVCWDFSYPIPEKKPVTLSGSGLCKILDYVTTVTEQTPSLAIGKYYQLYVKIEGATAGSIEFFLGTVSIGTVDENGIFTLSGVSDGTTFSFTMSEFFDGCVAYVEIYLLSKDYTLKLKNSLNDDVVADLTTSLLYGEEIKEGTRGDLIQVCIPFGEEMSGNIIPRLVNNSLCMYLEIESPTDGDLVTAGDFLLTNSFTLEDEWSFTGTLEYIGIQGHVELSGGTGYMLQDLGPAGFVQGNTYYVAFDILCYDHGDTDPDFDSFTVSLGTDSAGAGGEMVFNSDNFPTAAGHYVYKVVAGATGNYIAFYFTDADGLSRICIDNVQVRDTACEYELYRSNCIKYANEFNDELGWPDSKLVTACNEEGFSFGFDWSTGFKLQSRLYMDITTPRYSSKEDETYLQSNGVRKRVFADSSKILDCRIGAVDELTHDYIRTMFKCDVLFIDNGYTPTNQYIHLEAEYSPNYDSKGLLKLTDCITELQKVDNTIFNTNCR